MDLLEDPEEPTQVPFNVDDFDIVGYEPLDVDNETQVQFCVAFCCFLSVFFCVATPNVVGLGAGLDEWRSEH